LAATSHPKVVIDTSDLSWEATELTNYLAGNISELQPEDFHEVLHEIKKRVHRNRSS